MQQNYLHPLTNNQTSSHHSSADPEISNPNNNATAYNPSGGSANNQ